MKRLMIRVSRGRKPDTTRYDVLVENGEHKRNVSYSTAKRWLRELDKKGIGACMKPLVDEK
jgi:transposase